MESLTCFSELQIIILILEKKELNAQDFHSTTQGQGLSKAYVLSLQLLAVALEVTPHPITVRID